MIDSRISRCLHMKSPHKSTGRNFTNPIIAIPESIAHNDTHKYIPVTTLSDNIFISNANMYCFDLHTSINNTINKMIASPADTNTKYPPPRHPATLMSITAQVIHRLFFSFIPFPHIPYSLQISGSSSFL